MEADPPFREAIAVVVIDATERRGLVLGEGGAGEGVVLIAEGAEVLGEEAGVVEAVVEPQDVAVEVDGPAGEGVIGVGDQLLEGKLRAEAAGVFLS